MERQREHCEQFANNELLRTLGVEAPPWGATHEYSDDDSGGEFVERDGLNKLLAVTRPGDFVIARDLGRLGRDVLEAPRVIRALVVDRGARLFFYGGEDRGECLARTPEQIVILVLRALSPHRERLDIQSRAREAARWRINLGKVAGGKRYGHRNVRVAGPNGKLMTERIVDPFEASVVVRMYEDRGRGIGWRDLAKKLLDDGVPSPRGKPWSHTTVRSIVTNPAYRGLVVHGEEVMKTIENTRVRVQAPEDEIIRRYDPRLRIVSDEMWFAAQPEKRERAPVTAAPRPGPNRRHPLSGTGRCAVCGGPMMIGNSKDGTKPQLVYLCAQHRNKGSEVCANKLRRPKDLVEDTLIDFLKREVLTERMVEEVLRRVRARLRERQRDGSAGIDAMVKDADKLRHQIRRLVDQLADEPESGGLLEGLREREKKLKMLDQEIAVARRAPAAIDFELNQLQRDAHSRLADLKRTFVENQEGACRLVQALFPGGLRFEPTVIEGKKRYQITGEAVLGPAVLVEPPNVTLMSVPSRNRHVRDQKARAGRVGGAATVLRPGHRGQLPQRGRTRRCCHEALGPAPTGH